MKFADITNEQLIKLRKEIVLNSLYYHDYVNSFDIPRKIVCDFFDGFMDFLTELEKEDTGKTDMPINEFFEKYDTEENLIEWYYCHETFGDEEAWEKWCSLSDEEKEEFNDFDEYYEYFRKNYN